MKQIPLEGGAINAHQTFTVTLGDREITFELDFMGYTDHPAWNCNLYENGKPLVYGLLLVTGGDLLAPYHLNLGQLWMAGDEPTLENLGIDNELVWIE